MDRACKIELDSDTVRSFASKFGQILTSVFLNSLLVSLTKKKHPNSDISTDAYLKLFPFTSYTCIQYLTLRVFAYEL